MFILIKNAFLISQRSKIATLMSVKLQTDYMYGHVPSREDLNM